MAVLPIIVARKSEDAISVVPGSQLSLYPITEWDIRVIIILWVLFFITSVFVVLRFYSRIRILQFYALEDHLYNVAFVSSKFPPVPFFNIYFYIYIKIAAAWTISSSGFPPPPLSVEKPHR